MQFMAALVLIGTCLVNTRINSQLMFPVLRATSATDIHAPPQHHTAANIGCGTLLEFHATILQARQAASNPSYFRHNFLI